MMVSSNEARECFVRMGCLSFAEKKSVGRSLIVIFLVVQYPKSAYRRKEMLLSFCRYSL